MLVYSVWRQWGGALAVVIFLGASCTCFQLFCHSHQAHAIAIFLNAFDQTIRGAGELSNLLVDAETAVGAVRSISLQAEKGTNL